MTLITLEAIGVAESLTTWFLQELVVPRWQADPRFCLSRFVVELLLPQLGALERPLDVEGLSVTIPTSVTYVP